MTDDVERGKKPINERFAYLIANPYRSDFKFIIEDDGVVIPAHKFILSAGSLVLDRIVYGNEASESVDNTTVDQISNTAFTEILRYLYTDEANITDANAFEIMIKANYYDLLLLEQKCIEVLQNAISRTNCFTYFSKGYALYGNNPVVKTCLEFIQFAPNVIFKNENFPDLEIYAIIEILRNDVINITEYELYESLLLWATENCKRQEFPDTTENKRDLIKDALKLIRFTTLTADEFTRCLNLPGSVLTPNEITEIKNAITKNQPNAVKREFYSCQGIMFINSLIRVSSFSLVSFFFFHRCYMG